MDRVIKEYFTGSLNKFNYKDIRSKEVIYWIILLMNLLSVYLHIFSGGLLFVILNGAAVVWMLYVINRYYRYERDQ